MDLKATVSMRKIGAMETKMAIRDLMNVLILEMIVILPVMMDLQRAM